MRLHFGAARLEDEEKATLRQEHPGFPHPHFHTAAIEEEMSDVCVFFSIIIIMNMGKLNLCVSRYCSTKKSESH